MSKLSNHVRCLILPGFGGYFLFGTLALLPMAVHAAIRDNNPYSLAWSCKDKDHHWVCRQTSSNLVNLYDHHEAPQTKRSALIHALGWIKDSSGSQNCNACGGHYFEATQTKPNKVVPLSLSTSTINYATATYPVKGNATLSGNVMVNQPGRELLADQAIVIPNHKTKKIEAVKAHGNLRYHEYGRLIIGDSGYMHLGHNQATLHNAYYLQRVTPKVMPSAADFNQKNFTGFAHGHAKLAHQMNDHELVLKDATYTTCPPTRDIWSLWSSKVNLNKKTGRGHAYNTILRVGGLPVFYFPFFSFPIDSRRQSGFLFPRFGRTSSSGYFTTLPYYFNLAPNYDDTITPTLYSRRGLLIDNKFRYLLPNQSTGEVNINYMHHDKIYNNSRKSASINLNTNLPDAWLWTVNYNYLSDPTFQQDLNQGDIVTANQLYSSRQTALSKQFAHWQVSALVQHYKVLNTILRIANQPYSVLPQIEANGDYQLFSPNFLFHMDNQFSNFYKSTDGVVTGQRYHTRPSLTYQFQRDSGYITPELQLDATHYQLKSNPRVNQINRILPIVSIDSGLYFVRNFKWGQGSYEQTLNPRLYYLYVPYRNQADIPLFDTSIISPSYYTLFMSNRFSGLDRQSNANQISYAVDTSINNQAGSSLIDLSVGQSMYFQKRKVTLCQTSGCIKYEDPTYANQFSDLMSQMQLNLGNHWSIQNQVAFNLSTRQPDSQQYGFHYQTDNMHIFDLAYQNSNLDYALLTPEQIESGKTPPQISQILISSAWGVLPNLMVYGQWDYAFNANRTVDVFAGLEYSSCCWAFRFLFHRFISNADPNNPASLDGATDSVPMIEFELKGLGGTNYDTSNALLDRIPGYTVTKEQANEIL